MALPSPLGSQCWHPSKPGGACSPRGRGWDEAAHQHLWDRHGNGWERAAGASLCSRSGRGRAALHSTGETSGTDGLENRALHWDLYAQKAVRWYPATRKHQPRKSPGVGFNMLEKAGAVFTFLPHLSRSGLSRADAPHWDTQRRKC